MCTEIKTWTLRNKKELQQLNSGIFNKAIYFYNVSNLPNAD